MTKTRKKADKKTDGTKDTRMPTSVFVPLYLEAVAKGMTRQDFAESIGIQASSVYQRIHDYHAKGYSQTEFPHLKARGKRSLKETVDAALAAFKNGATSPKAKDELADEAVKVSAKAAAAVTEVEVEEKEYDPAAELDRLLGN
jgi:hypothetical protein